MTEASQTPPATPLSTPMPNDAAARSPTGEILEPSQIVATPATPSPSTPSDGTQEPTSTPKPEAKPEVPATYTDFTAPEGYTIDPKTLEAATPIFKDLGLTQDQAQKLVDFHTQQMIAAAKAPASEYEATRTTWRAQVDSDPDIKSAVMDGKAGLDAVKLGISKTLAALGDPALTAEFKTAMDLTGAGDHPAFIKAMWKLASFVTEGSHVAGTKPSPHGQTPPGQDTRPSAAKSLYPNLPG